MKDFSPSHAGQIIFVQSFSMAIMAPCLASRFQPRLIATLGCAIVACGLFVLSRMDMQTSATYISSCLLLVGTGFGLFSTPNNNAIMAAVQHHEVGVALASINLARTIGKLMGMSLVNLMVHYYPGDAQFTAEQNTALIKIIELALNISLAFVVTACAISWLRGKSAHCLIKRTCL